MTFRRPAGTAMFFLWIESQSTPVIALVVFSFCYLLAAAIYFGTTAFCPRITASPSMLSAIGVVTGLVIAFTASHVWTNLASAEDYVVREASAIRDTILVADALPDELRARVKAGIRTYLHFIDAEDWPAMEKGTASIRTPPPGLAEALTSVLAANLTESGQRAAQERISVTITQALDARRHRVLLSEAAINPIEWLVIFLLDALMLTTIRFVHDKRAAAAANMFVFSSAVGACVLLLMVSDRPFSTGGTTLEPGALHEVSQFGLTQVLGDGAR